ncbi:arsenate reductase (glutaredoxin) [Antrihabitans sp. YC3-6]|uniref:arsenate reductase (glutathione/glutaredoxin) n=1 Tax=Antrihabitans stalagmiti TaxID=2799499 RepID=A0A934U4K8_9NOCA|nr:arsenate reductase (glutaredoxin) [Antrihabitans stalagmiti]MBJ8340531.1 arsenate reductase (glutaredoxin) [Antrihabitans stalagmiti]
MATTAIIYHNPRCSTSRTVLRILEQAGVETEVVKYLDTPPTRDGLRKLLDDAGLRPSQAIRKREAIYSELGLADADDTALIDAMVTHPILIERPIVVTAKGTRLARPAETVREIL